jgi:hypothetical protein|tara:strand:+ start:410 stop:718 length:309 start_codon:yes stop_codon:yes gene_type:complete
MKNSESFVQLSIPAHLAVDFADGLDIAASAMECVASKSVERSFGDLMMQLAESGTTQEDMDTSVSALKVVRMMLGRELPKHFPELSRAARRGQLETEDEDGL